MKKTLHLLALILGPSLIAPLQAQVLISRPYTQGALDGDGADASDRANPQIAASVFTISSSTSIESLRFWGGYFDSNTPQALDNFEIRIYSDSSSLPDTLLATRAFLNTDLNRQATGFTDLGVTVFSYETDIASIALTAGTYWLSVSNDTTTDIDDHWVWYSQKSIGATVARSTNDGISWPGSSANESHNLVLFSSSLSAIPEPATSASLIGVAFLILAVARRRKRA